jgi:hypothetical protein
MLYSLLSFAFTIGKIWSSKATQELNDLEDKINHNGLFSKIYRKIAQIF